MVFYSFEKALSARGSCQGCKRRMPKGKLRIRVDLSMAGDYFLHTHCASPRIVKWMQQKGASAKNIPAALITTKKGSLPPSQMKEAKKMMAVTKKTATIKALMQSPAAKVAKKQQKKALKHLAPKRRLKRQWNIPAVVTSCWSSHLGFLHPANLGTTSRATMHSRPAVH
jgi:hypothetical protein